MKELIKFAVENQQALLFAFSAISLWACYEVWVAVNRPKQTPLERVHDTEGEVYEKLRIAQEKLKASELEASRAGKKGGDS